MIVGLPGAGISGIFYVACVFLMPFHAAWQIARGRKLPAGQWRRIARHWVIGAGILAVLYLIGWGLGLAAPGATPGIVSVPGEALGPAVAPSPVESLAKVGAMLTAITLGGVIVAVQLMSMFFRARGGASGAQRPDGAQLTQPTSSRSSPAALPQVIGRPELRDVHRFRRALVTGGAGFIGSHIAEALSASGCEIIVLDDLSAGSRAQVPDGAQFILADIADPATVELISRARPDLVIHAAARVSVSESMADPGQDRAVNVVGTQHVVDGARAAGAHRLVFISSGGAIYGDTAAADELTLPAPANFYGIHKLAAEGYVSVSGLSYGIVRFANVYGPRQRAGLEGGVVAIFLAAIRAKRPITIFGSGNQVRDFLHVQDAVAGVLAVAEAPHNGIWNVGTGVATSINALLAQMESAVGSATHATRTKPRAGDVGSSLLVIDRIRADLGWEPSISLSDGIRALAATDSAINPADHARPPQQSRYATPPLGKGVQQVTKGRLSGWRLPSSR